MKISELVQLGGVPPPKQDQQSVSPKDLESIKELYLHTYAPGIDKFLETRWYTTKGLPALMANEILVAKMANILPSFRSIDHQGLKTGIPSQEADMVWSLMELCRSSGLQTDGITGSDASRDVDLRTAIARLNVLETLITGEDLAPNPVPPSQMRNNQFRPTSFPEQLQEREKELWYTIGEFVSINNGVEAERALFNCRAMLDTFENRDVIYSIAVVHHIGRLYPNLARVPTSSEEQSALDKLYVATKFLQDEAEGRGTNQVIQRLCGMAVRSFTRLTPD